MVRVRSDAQRKAMFAHLKGTINTKECKNKFAIDPVTFKTYYDPWAIQPQTSFLMMDPSLGIGPMNLTSKRPKKECKDER